MRRMTVHRDFPFTEEEIAAGWVLLGWAAEEARSATRDLVRELSVAEAPAVESESGWVIMGPRIWFSPGVVEMFQVVADIRSGGTFLSAEARVALNASWTHRLPAAKAEAALNELERLGDDWAKYRATFRRILLGEGE